MIALLFVRRRRQKQVQKHGASKEFRAVLSYDLAWAFMKNTRTGSALNEYSQFKQSRNTAHPSTWNTHPRTTLNVLPALLSQHLLIHNLSPFAFCGYRVPFFVISIGQVDLIMPELCMISKQGTS